MLVLTRDQDKTIRIGSRVSLKVCYASPTACVIRFRGPVELVGSIKLFAVECEGEGDAKKVVARHELRTYVTSEFNVRHGYFTLEVPLVEEWMVSLVEAEDEEQVVDVMAVKLMPYKMRIGVKAPPCIEVHRLEIYRAARRDRQKAAKEAAKGNDDSEGSVARGDCSSGDESLRRIA